MAKYLEKNRLLVIPFIMIYFWILVSTAWACDDAYITFRSMENFIHGYGPVFNVGERVQIFTHPLWFFILSGLNFITQHIGALNAWAQTYYVAIFLSIGISILSVLILGFAIARSTKSSVLSVIILTLSKSFVDYSTSGLENPLTHFLLAIFFYIFMYHKRFGKSRYLYLCVIASLGVLNRMDTLFLFAPVLFYEFWKTQTKVKSLGLAVLGFTPFIVWEIFSLFYYGFLFPNTAYAKLNTGINKLDLFQQGVMYLFNSLQIDSITLLVIIITGLSVIMLKRFQQFPVVISILLYLGYTSYIGGDFMSGRFFAAPLFLATILISQYNFKKTNIWLTLVIGVIVVGVIHPTSPLRSTQEYGTGDFRQYINDYGISDERAVYFEAMGMVVANSTEPPPGSRFSGRNWVYDDEFPVQVKLVGPLGVSGYQAGPSVHVIDRNALADPLMVHMPLVSVDQWRIGHFRHVIPDGYIETLTYRENQIIDENIARYYDVLSVITRGDLWDAERIKEIWNLNIGRYEYLLQ
jgi:arabinofuranosyltransferase